MQQDWRKRNFGLLFVLTLVLALAALFQDFRFDGWSSGERASLVARDRLIGSLDLDLSELRGAQTGYLATGRGPDAWMQQTAELSGRLESTLTSLREGGSVPGAALPRYDAAMTALATLGALDRKARDQIQSDQRFLAADTIFVDGGQAADQFRAEIAAARAAEAASSDARLQRLSTYRLALNAGTVALALLMLLSLGRPPRPTAASEAEALAQMIRELPPAVKAPAPARPQAPMPAAAPAAPSALPMAAAAPLAAVNLPDAADVCVDLARVMDSRDVPALLERVATVLGAKGVIIWTVDSAGTTLAPALTHGYSGKVLTRLGTLDVDADNVTSLSFRSMRPQQMGGESGSAGALAVPLITASGCSGVLAAELRDGTPAPETLALTRILAAQFATLVVTPAQASNIAVAQA